MTEADPALRSSAVRRRALRAARRHSAWVRALRLGTPAAAVLVLALFLYDARPEGTATSAVEIGDVSIDNGALIMENPRLNGRDRNEQVYSVAAETAAQTLINPDIVDLTQVNATLTSEAQGDARILAGSGRFDQKSGTLKLEDGVEVHSSTGYDVKLERAEVDLEGGGVQSDSPVSVEMLNGRINAEGVEIQDKGEVMIFKDRVHMKMRMRAPDAGQGDER